MLQRTENIIFTMTDEFSQIKQAFPDGSVPSPGNVS